MIVLTWVKYTWNHFRILPLQMVRPLQALYHRLAGEMTPAVTISLKKPWRLFGASAKILTRPKKRGDFDP